MIMERAYTAFAYNLSQTANILNVNMNQIGNMISVMTTTNQLNTPSKLHFPESGSSQQRANISTEMVANIDRIPMSIPYAESESQSSFDPNAQVINIGYHFRADICPLLA